MPSNLPRIDCSATYTNNTCWSLGQVHTYVSHTAVFRVYAQSSRSLIFPGQTRDFPIVADWEEIKVDVMYVANRLKFQQNKVG